MYMESISRELKCPWFYILDKVKPVVKDDSIIDFINSRKFTMTFMRHNNMINWNWYLLEIINSKDFSFSIIKKFIRFNWYLYYDELYNMDGFNENIMKKHLDLHKRRFKKMSWVLDVKNCNDLFEHPNFSFELFLIYDHLDWSYVIREYVNSEYFNDEIKEKYSKFNWNKYIN